VEPGSDYAVNPPASQTPTPPVPVANVDVVGVAASENFGASTAGNVQNDGNQEVEICPVCKTEVVAEDDAQQINHDRIDSPPQANSSDKTPPSVPIPGD